MADKYLIAPFTMGIQKDLEPWLLPDQAYEQLNNAYIYRGKVVKRFGAMGISGIFGLDQLGSRLRLEVKTGTVPGAVFAIGQAFSVGDDILTVNALGVPATLLTTNGAITGTYNTTTGAYVIVGAGATPIYFYPATPVMGFADYESTSLNDEPTYAFDTQFAYQIVNNVWERLGAGAATWTGTDSDFFWTHTYRGVTADLRTLFVTNHVQADGIRYFDGTTWFAYSPVYVGANVIISCKLIVGFKERLLLLNTIESGGTFVNRVRYSAKGSPFAVNAFIEVPNGNGGFFDIPVKESIISCREFKDRLIIYCERSTWEIVSTSNAITPFKLRQINGEYGAESTFSVVPFDAAILSVGENGINACNCQNVDRIDSAIPDEVFKFHNDNNGQIRVHGIRDYRAGMVYWTVPQEKSTAKFPNRILAYNHNTNSWSFFDDSITCFGYYYYQDDVTWADINMAWEEYDASWNSYIFDEAYRTPIAGNQTGYTFVIVPELSFNAPSLQITDIVDAAGVVTITSINHNLKSGDWIFIEDCVGITELNGENFRVNTIDADSFTIDESPVVSGTYAGGGIIILVSKIDIKTKRFNFYTNVGAKTSIEKTDFLVDKIDNGAITVDYLAGFSGISLRDDGIATGAILGNGILSLEPYAMNTCELNQDKFWHSVFLQAQGDTVQLRLYWSYEQMKNVDLTTSGFTLHAILIDASKVEPI